MPLNPQTQALLKKLTAAATQHITEIAIEDIRANALKNYKSMSYPMEPVDKVEDIKLSGPYGALPIRVYTSIGKDHPFSPFPALIYFFGGGFVFGSIEAHDNICRALAKATGCKVIAVSYHLAPEYKFPVAINEAYFAVEWVFKNAAILDIDPHRIAVSGYSAGGNLAALTAIKCRDSGLPLAYQVLICAWLDLSSSTPSYQEFAHGYLSDPARLNWFVKNYLPEDMKCNDPKVSPLWEKNLRGVAPALIITAEYDALRDEGDFYAKKLRSARIDAIYSCYLGQIHQLLAYRGELDQEKNPIDEIGAVIKQVMWKAA